MDGVIDEIKQKLDIVEVLSEYIRLAKAGRNYKARCPFHTERTPSFMVSQERQIWRCFGCGAGGDIFAFVMKMEGLEFGDALRLLARKAGVVLKKQDPQVQSAKKRLYEICELAAKFFETQLQKSVPGKQAGKYLLERGLKPETINKWRVGWAPDNWRATSDFLKSKGYKDAEILQAGLVVEKESGGQGERYYDRFRSRIIFPIFDLQGQVIAFGGRIFGVKAKDDLAKYVNSPQTPLYDKGRVLYGLHAAKMEIRSKDECLIVEGYMDLLMSWQAGVTNLVASSGTALTEEQLKIIGRYTQNMAMAFDADIAGDNATRRSIDMALRQDFNVKVIPLKEKDPADIIKKNPADWPKALSQAQSAMEFYFTTALAKYDSRTIEGKRDIKKALLPRIKILSSYTEQADWLGELAHKLRVDERDLRQDMAKIKDGPGESRGAEKDIVSPVIQNHSRLEDLEERLVSLCINYPQHWPSVSAMGEMELQSQQLAQIFHQLRVLMGENKKGDMASQLRKTLSPDLRVQLDYLSLKIDQQPVVDELKIISEMEVCFRELKVVKVKQQLTALSFDIQEVQRAGNQPKLQKLLEKFSRLALDLNELTKR